VSLSVVGVHGAEGRAGVERSYLRNGQIKLAS
jgi:hypothetical protein